MTNPINLGSPAKLTKAGDSSAFLDSALGGCNDPTNYPGGTSGDGGDVVSACPNVGAGSLGDGTAVSKLCRTTQRRSDT